LGSIYLSKRRGNNYGKKEKGIKKSKGVNVIMVSALDDPKNVIKAFKKGEALAYLAKPIVKAKVLEEIQNLGLI